jgi:hypothetical protein
MTDPCSDWEHDWKTVIFNGYGLGRVCNTCGKQVLDDNEDPGEW